MKKFVKLTGLFALLLGLFVVVGCQEVSSISDLINSTTTQQGPTDGSTNDSTTEDPAIAEYNRQVLQIDTAAVMAVVKANVTTFKALSLPTVCANGSTVTWVSSDETVIRNDGTLPAITNDGLNADGSLPTAELTATISYAGLSNEYKVKVTVDRRSDYADAVYNARSALLTLYEGAELNGYKLSFTNEGKAIYTFEFAKRNDVTITYSSTERIQVNPDGYTAVVNRPASLEETGGTRNYVFDKVIADITLGTCTAHIEVPVMITIGQQLISLQELKTLMAEDR